MWERSVRDKFSVVLTCRTWAKVAIGFLYEHFYYIPHMHHQRSHNFITNLPSRCPYLEESNLYGSLVRHFDCVSPWSISRGREIISLCSNLETLRVFIPILYADVLLSFPSTLQSLPRLRVLAIHGRHSIETLKPSPPLKLENLQTLCLNIPYPLNAVRNWQLPRLNSLTTMVFKNDTPHILLLHGKTLTTLLLHGNIDSEPGDLSLSGSCPNLLHLGITGFSTIPDALDSHHSLNTLVISQPGVRAKVFDWTRGSSMNRGSFPSLRSVGFLYSGISGRTICAYDGIPHELREMWTNEGILVLNGNEMIDYYSEG